MTKLDKVMLGLQKLAEASGYPLEIAVVRPNDVWMIRFTAGYAAVQTSLETFGKVPQIMLEPFCDEIIRKNL